MKISKYLHSCVLFELDGYKLLFDPGKFSFAEGLVKPEMFADVNSVIITHNHPDHLDKENLQKIIDLSAATVSCNAEVGGELEEAGISYELIEPGELKAGPFKLNAIAVTHEPIMDSPLPQMLAFLINDEVLYPVDSMQDSLLEYKGIALLLMVTMAPFANELRISGFADKLQPKKILPVHDGYAKGFFIKQRYEAYRKHFEKQGIEFLDINEAGQSITV